MPHISNDPKKQPDEKRTTRGGGEMRLSPTEVKSLEEKAARRAAAAKGPKPSDDAPIPVYVDEEPSTGSPGRPVFDLDRELGIEVPPNGAPQPETSDQVSLDAWDGLAAKPPAEIGLGVPKVITSLRQFLNELVERLEDNPELDPKTVVIEAMADAILIPGSVKAESPEKLIERYGKDKQSGAPLLNMLGDERAALVASTLLAEIGKAESGGRYLSRKAKEFLRDRDGKLPESVSRAQLQEGCDARATAIAQLLIAKEFRVRSRIKPFFTDAASGTVAPGQGERLLGLFDTRDFSSMFRHKIEDEMAT